LVDSVRKKTEFLKHLISILSLSGVDVVWGRAEDAAVALREKFDISLSRAVAPLNILVEYSFPFLKVGGSMISLKGAEIQKEIDSCAEALKTLGGEIVSEVKVNIPGTDIVRSIVVIDKTRKTPEGFPRRAGMAKKRPL
jgi:16S rRNA (guanine527-N7)-methyltransferase